MEQVVGKLVWAAQTAADEDGQLLGDVLDELIMSSERLCSIIEKIKKRRPEYGTLSGACQMAVEELKQFVQGGAAPKLPAW